MEFLNILLMAPAQRWKSNYVFFTFNFNHCGILFLYDKTTNEKTKSTENL